MNNNSYRQGRINSIDNDNLKCCATCLKTKQVSEFKENGNEYKVCNPCRSKPKQQLLLIKEKLVGGKTKVCCYCNIEKDLTNYLQIKCYNKVGNACNACLKQRHENFKLERQQRLALATIPNNTDDSNNEH